METVKQQPLVSVIVPVYNTEKYLRKCVDSIIGQTYKNLEIILVDDGSPDSSGHICDEYAQRDERVQVIHKENGGLSDARNTGIKVARGEYLGFVDSDDWIEPQMYQKLIENSIKFNAEISVGGVAELKEKDGQYEQIRIWERKYATGGTASKIMAMKEFFLGSWSAWDKIYRKEIFDDIVFPFGIINEDDAIALRQLDKCSNVCYTDEPFYNYIHHMGETSITQENFSKKKLVVVDICKANLDFVKNYYPELTEYAEYKYFMRILWCLNHMAVSKQDFSSDIERLRKILKKDIKKLYSNSYTSRKEKFRGFLMVHCYNIFSISVRVLKKKYT